MQEQTLQMPWIKGIAVEQRSAQGPAASISPSGGPFFSKHTRCGNPKFHLKKKGGHSLPCPAKSNGLARLLKRAKYALQFTCSENYQDRALEKGGPPASGNLCPSSTKVNPTRRFPSSPGSSGSFYVGNNLEINSP